MIEKKFRGFETLQLVIAAVFLAILVLLTGINLADLSATQASLESVQKVEDHITSYISILKDADRGQRGYLLTGDKRYLTPYTRAQKTLTAHLEVLKTATNAPTAAKLQDLSDRKMAELKATIEIQDRGDTAGAIRLIKTNHGRDDMLAIGAIIRSIRREQVATFRKYQQHIKEQTRLTLITACAGSGVLFSFLCLGSLIISQMASKRESVIAELSESQRQTDDARRTMEATLMSSGDAIITTDIQGRVLFMNHVAESLTGTNLPSARGKSLTEVFAIVNETTREVVENPVDKVRRQGTVVGMANHTVLLRRDGTETPIEDSSAPIRTLDGTLTGVVLVFRDATSRRQAAQRIEESERLYRQLADSMPQIVWVADIAGSITFTNERCSQLLGVSVDQLHEHGWAGLLHQADVEAFETAWSYAVQNKRSFDYECQLKQTRTGRYRWFLCRAVPVWDRENMGVLRWFGTFTDIDNHKQVENDLRRANEDLSQFAFSASHDLQEPVRNLTMFTQLFAKRNIGKVDAESEEMIRLVVAGAQRMEAMIRDLLLYVRTANTSMTDAPVIESLEALGKALENLQPTIEETGAKIQPENLPPIRIEEVHLQQLFQNLVSNSLKYRSSEPPRIRIHAERRRDEWLLGVEDNGIGIDPRYSKQIFGLFKRLHGQSEFAGTGIGLALCQKIVERYDGRIWVESEPGKGSHFYFTLPA